MKHLKTVISILVITIFTNLMSYFVLATSENEISSLADNITENEILEAFNDTLNDIEDLSLQFITKHSH